MCNHEYIVCLFLNYYLAVDKEKSADEKREMYLFGLVDDLAHDWFEAISGRIDLHCHCHWHCVLVKRHTQLLLLGPYSCPKIDTFDVR